MIDYQELKIAPASEDDREFSFEVKKLAMGPFIQAIWGWDEPRQRELHERDWRDHRPSIISYAGRPIGTIYTGQEKCHLEIEQFYLLPQYQDQGIGSHLLKEILAGATVPVRLSVLKNNPALEFYRRHGFHTIIEDENFCHMEYLGQGIKKKRYYRAVVFDLFGTLVDVFSRWEYESVLREMANVLRVPWEVFRKIWLETAPQRAIGGFTTLEDNLAFICRKLDITVTPEQLESARRIRFAYVERALKPRPGVLIALRFLKSNGYRTGLLSNCSMEPPLLWSKTEMAPFFDAAIFSSTSGLQKPDTRIYLRLAEQLKVAPEDCLYIGDGDNHELTGARQAGMYPLLVMHPGTRAEKVMSDPEADRWTGPVIYSLPELVKFL